MLYCLLVIIFSTLMIYRVAPKYGKSNPLVFLSICSTVGSVSVMSVKAFGIALKLTLNGNNQFTHPSTYVFIIVTTGSILVQMNYLNKALSQFSTSIVNPLYYVTFTTATLCASFILFQGFNTVDAVNTISLLCGFLIIFAGVYLLNIARGDPSGRRTMNGRIIDEEGIPTDPVAGLQTRRSMQARRSASISNTRHGSGVHRRSSSLTFTMGEGQSRENEGLMQSYEVEHGAFGLKNLEEEPEDEEQGTSRTRSRSRSRRTSVDDELGKIRQKPPSYAER
jgi:magnesium transporter